jgi:SAM-dependent methyltransferase
VHISSLEHINRLVGKFLSNRQTLSALDIGSMDVNGTYRKFFERPRWSYVGLDLTEGPNVDVVLTSTYRLPIPSFSQDVIVCGQVFEHVQFFWLTWLEMIRVLRPGGYIFLVAPSRGPEHRYPKDCWRFYPDGFQALALYGGLDLLEVSTDWEPSAHADSAPWGDTVGVFQQKQLSWLERIRMRFMQQVRYQLLPGFRV